MYTWGIDRYVPWVLLQLIGLNYDNVEFKLVVLNNLVYVREYLCIHGA